MATRTQNTAVAKLVDMGADIRLTTFWSTGPGKSVPSGRENVSSMRDDEVNIMISELRGQLSSATANTRVMCCSACGDDIPCVRTPRGWLCHECAKGV